MHLSRGTEGSSPSSSCLCWHRTRYNSRPFPSLPRLCKKNQDSKPGAHRPYFDLCNPSQSRSPKIVPAPFCKPYLSFQSLRLLVNGPIHLWDTARSCDTSLMDHLTTAKP